jgi:hypothetical protein
MESTTNMKCYIQSNITSDTMVEVDLQGFTRMLQAVKSNVRGQAWLRQHHRLLKRRAQAVNTYEVFAGVMRGDAESQQAWGVFCDDCAELACVEIEQAFRQASQTADGPRG